ncbi:hypothetical protein [Lysinibacillus sp. FSL M8-0355]|uniref:hypothetical protein n=1 Tax=Lysinibacillus sp. FSL M8-0355 TaxID=2921719 RepID=UPI0030F6A652
MKTLVKVKENSFPVRYDDEVYKVGEELEVLSEHAEHPSFEILSVIETSKKRTTKSTEPTD